VGADERRIREVHVTVYRKQPDGRWLLARDAHTLSPIEP
jgi:ketosteroid isomerase-like protein